MKTLYLQSTSLEKAVLHFPNSTYNSLHFMTISSETSIYSVWNLHVSLTSARNFNSILHDLLHNMFFFISDEIRQDIEDAVSRLSPWWVILTFLVTSLYEKNLPSLQLCYDSIMELMHPMPSFHLHFEKYCTI